MKAFLALTKPRLTALSVMSGVIGYLLGGGGGSMFSIQFLWSLLGICLLGGGANAMNMLLEKEYDAQMDRTKNRPLPSKQLNWQQVLAYAITISASGLYILSAHVNALAGWLGLMTLVSYVMVYTPLKRRTTLNTLVGAIPGALPPLIGFAAAVGTLDERAVFIAAILFMWQMPHFFALSWVHREDYRKAGFKMLCVFDDEKGSVTARQTNMFVFFLIPISLAPVHFGFASQFYLVVASILGMIFLMVSAFLFKGVTDQSARRVFHYSIVYLPLLMICLVVDVNMDAILESLLL